MSANEFKFARDKAMRELRTSVERRNSLEKELARLNLRIEELRKGVEGLNALCGDVSSIHPDLVIEISNLNLADATRAVLSASEFPVTPLDIRFQLKRLGYKIEDHANALASIHTILKRIEEAGQAYTINKDGKTAYRLKTEVNNDESTDY